MMFKPGVNEDGLQREDSQKVEKWLYEENVTGKFKHRAITPAALELFGDAAVAEQQQLPPRCKTSLGGVRHRARSLDIKPSACPSPYQHVPHQPHHLASTRHGGALYTGHELAGAFELPGRCHSSMDVTRPEAPSLHPHPSQPHPQAALPPKPGTSVMAQRSANSCTGGNPYHAWASPGPSASPDPTANPSPITHTTPRVSSLLHAAAAHRAGGTPAAVTSASRAATPSERSSPASKVRSSLDRAREILQGCRGPTKEHKKQAGNSGSSRAADTVPGYSRTSLDRPHAAAHWSTPSTPVHFSRATPEPSQYLSTDSPSLGVSGSATNIPSHGPAHGRGQHRHNSRSAKQDSIAAAQPRFLPGWGSGEAGDLESISEAKDQEACSTLEAIQRDAELELRKLDQQPITSTHGLNRPGSPTLYAWEEQQALPSEEQRQQQAWFTQHLEAQAKEGRGPAWEKPVTSGQFHKLRDPSPTQTRISLEAGVGGSKDAADHKLAPHCTSKRASIDFGTHTPQDRDSRPSSLDSLEGFWPGWHGSRQGMGKPSGASVQNPSAAAPPVACDGSTARLPHCEEQGQARFPSAPQDESRSSIFKDSPSSPIFRDHSSSPIFQDSPSSPIFKDLSSSPISRDPPSSPIFKGPSSSSIFKDSPSSPIFRDPLAVTPRASDYSVALSSRCTSPASSTECNRHSAPTTTSARQKHGPGPPSPHQHPIIHSCPGGINPASTPTFSAHPLKTQKSSPLFPTPHSHHQQPIEAVHGSMLFAPGGGTVVRQGQAVRTAARRSLHSQPDYSSEDDNHHAPSRTITHTSDSHVSYRATPWSPPHLPPSTPAPVHAATPRGSLDLGRHASPHVHATTHRRSSLDLSQHASPHVHATTHMRGSLDLGRLTSPRGHTTMHMRGSLDLSRHASPHVHATTHMRGSLDLGRHMSPHVHAAMRRGSLDLSRCTSPLTCPGEAEDLQQHASVGSFDRISFSAEGPTCKPCTLPPLHPIHGTMHSHPSPPHNPYGDSPQRSGLPRSSSGSCSAVMAPKPSKDVIDSKQEPDPNSEVTQSRTGPDSCQGASQEPDGKPKEDSAARGLWSKLGARGGLKRMSSKNLAQAFLNHLESSNDDFLVEAARNRAKSLTGDGDVRALGAGRKDCRHAPLEPTLPLSKAASRRFGIRPEGDDHASDDDDDDMLTPIERESMTTRQQKIWAKVRVTVRQAQIMKANPVAFNEEAALKAEAEAKAAAEHARRRFQDLCAMVCDARATGNFRNAVHHMQVNRPYFIPPVASKRSFVSRAAVSRKGEKVWRLEDSIFMKRAKENDARDVFDTPQVLERQFETDWARVSSKVRFRKMVTRQDQGLRDAAELERELDEVHDELQKRYTIIRAAFIYFSSFCGSTGSDTFLSMGLMEFHRMTRHCNIADPKTPGIRPSDIDTMFISTNFEEEGNSNEENDANDDNALVRFELLEIIVRMAIGKFIAPKVVSDVSDSVALLFDKFIEPNLPAVAKIDTNDFRRNRLYCKEMEMEVVRHWDLLQAMFKLYKARDRTRHFWVEHWIALLESTNLLGGHTGIDKHCAKVLFAFSQGTVVDELRRRQRAISLAFFDFVEALARLSEVLSPPTPTELQAMASARQPGLPADADGSSAVDETGTSGEEVPAKPPSLTMAGFYKRIQNDSVLRAARADRVGLGKELHLAAQQRPLSESFSGLMEMILSGLEEAWGGTKEAQTAARMQKMAQGISGGIELNT